MKTKTKYIADDGSEHDTAEAAIKRDELHRKCVEAMSPLGDTPEAVEDGKGWVHHNLATVNACKDRIFEICRELGYHNSFPIFNRAGSECAGMSMAYRILSDNRGPLCTAWGRFAQIDAQGREHQQPYYAMNQPSDEHVCIEDRR